MNNIKLKKCAKCGTEKSVSEFGKNSSIKDGLQSYCKACYNAYARDYYKDNKDKAKAKNKAYREEVKGYYLYLIYEGKQIVYVGSCSHLVERISNHINCHSNIADRIRKNTWTSIKYLDIGHLVNLKEEREFVEYILINELEPSWNVKGREKKLNDTEREQDLVSSALDIIDNLEYYFTTYRENYNSYYYYVNESNVEDYVMDISDIVSYYAELEEEDY